MSGHRFDWGKIRQQVDSAFAALDHENNRSPADIHRILEARAKAIAEIPVSAAATESIELLEFQLAHERYAIETRFVREAYPLDNLTPLPGTPDFVLGVVNIRGEIISVVDIKKFFGLPEQGITHLDKVIVLELSLMVFGILADHLDGVRHLPVADIQSAKQSPAGVDGGYILGITTDGLAILNGEALLTDENILVQ
jgi:purine-binding chemotaxis protein CheW